MRIISRKSLKEFWERYPDAEPSLTKWYKVAQGAKWESLQDVRMTFSSADMVKTGNGKNVLVFNIGGNNYRLIAAKSGNILFILHVLTHKEYDTDKWKR
ncbi:MAG: type II toxin-antitoxin system HigB family toxin [Nitrospinae bacterium]|nr:type II toxin-antitoxin system HigB family toxin [Nitrospinota bacterium]